MSYLSDSVCVCVCVYARVTHTHIHTMYMYIFICMCVPFLVKLIYMGFLGTKVQGSLLCECVTSLLGHQLELTQKYNY